MKKTKERPFNLLSKANKEQIMCKEECDYMNELLEQAKKINRENLKVEEIKGDWYFAKLLKTGLIKGIRKDDPSDE